MKKRRRRGGPRRKRPRPTPRWLSKSDQIDQVARGRCLLLLSVLSGEKPVTDAISEAGISRATYYQLETRALSAMLRALTPGASDEENQANSPQRRIAELEEKVKLLERGRRRSERLLLMTRRLVKTAEAKPKARKTGSTRSGKSPSPVSRTRKEPAAPNLTPTATGAGEP
jgi:hypothetical protein